MSIERVPAASVEEKLHLLEKEFAKQVNDPQGSDLGIAALYEALGTVFGSEDFRGDFRQAFERRPDLTVIHASNLGRIAITKQALRLLPEEKFFNRAHSPKTWSELLEVIARAPAARQEFRNDLNTRDVQTNEPERGKSLKLLSTFFQDRFDHQPRIIDFGCSQNHVLKKLVFNDLTVREMPVGFRYRDVAVRVPADGQVAGSEETYADPILTAHFSRVLNASRFAIGKSLGVDKWPLKRHQDIEWVRSSHHPLQLADPTCLEEFDLLEAVRTPKVTFRRVDITDPSVTEVSLPGGRRADIAFVSAMLYQLPPEQRAAAQEVIRGSVDPKNGVIVYQEFARVDPDDPSRLEVFDLEHWSDYTYRTIIEDMRHPGELQELFKWRTGRCREVQLGAGRLCVGKALRDAKELVSAQAA
jgi:hypothetical protein